MNFKNDKPPQNNTITKDATSCIITFLCQLILFLGCLILYFLFFLPYLGNTLSPSSDYVYEKNAKKMPVTFVTGILHYQSLFIIYLIIYFLHSEIRLTYKVCTCPELTCNFFCIGNVFFVFHTVLKACPEIHSYGS